MQHYVIKFVSHDITEILLKVALNTRTQPPLDGISSGINLEYSIIEEIILTVKNIGPGIAPGIIFENGLFVDT